MIKVLHFSDAHIDIASQGRREPVSGMPYRVLDFLKALDTIIDAAISEKVDLVLFAGDAYKDRNPLPTYQREWGRRIMRLSQAKIPTLLLVGNHDISPATGRANTLHEFDTLQVPYVKVIHQPQLLKPDDLWGLPVQVLGVPWVTRSGLMASLQNSGESIENIKNEIEQVLTQLIQKLLEGTDPTLPIILTAHASVQGAIFGNERSVMLGNDMILPGSLVCDPRIAYTALGHIHKAQDVHQGSQPPVVYPGSIERVDFNEAADEKYYVIANVGKGNTQFKFHTLYGRKFIDRSVKFDVKDDRGDFMAEIKKKIPSATELKNAIVRLSIEYPRDWEPLLDEIAIRKMTEDAFEFHLVRKPISETRLRLPNNRTWSDLSPMELLHVYLVSKHTKKEDAQLLEKYASEIINSQFETEEKLF
jgi:exonuclease SbcD